MQTAEKAKLSQTEKQKTLFKVLKLLTDELLSGNQSRLAACMRLDKATISRWYSRGAVGVNPDTGGNDYEVLIHLIAVHRALSSIFENPSDREAWFCSPNRHFRGESPESLLKSGIEGLVTVRQYLDHARGLGA